VPGVTSSLILIAAWLLLAYLKPDIGNFPQQYFLGGLILVMLCGEFSTSWSTRLRRAEETNHYLDERLSRITLRHLLLRLSHDRMEQEILTKPVTLRDALNGLRQLTTSHSGQVMPASISLLQMLTQYCQLESASISVPSEGGTQYVRTSEIGSPPELSPTDPLMLHALEHKSLAHLLTGGLADSELPSPFLVVAPILTSDGHQLGVLSINHMPFLALNEENLQMLSVMLGYYADCVVEADGARQFLEQFPDAPEDFAAEFSRLLTLQRNYDIDSHVIVLSFNNDENGHKAITQLARIRRGLDITWQMDLGERLILANLMPLANEPAVEGYLLRIENMLKEHVGIVHEELHLNPVEISLSEGDPVASLRHVIVGAVA
jgi:polysaccharide biosynthesis protein PelD